MTTTYSTVTVNPRGVRRRGRSRWGVGESLRKFVCDWVSRSAYTPVELRSGVEYGDRDDPGGIVASREG